MEEYGLVSYGSRERPVVVCCEQGKEISSYMRDRRLLKEIRRCMHRASSYNMYITNKMHEILVIRLYFILDALHVSDCISPSSGATL